MASGTKSSFSRRQPTASILRISKLVAVYLPPLNFITLHYAYFIGVCMISSLVLWGASKPAQSITYTDALFLAVSAMTLTGLNTINLSTLTTFQQIILFILTMMGSAILVSILVVHTRKRAFEHRFASVNRDLKARRRRRSSSQRRSSFRGFTSQGRGRSTEPASGMAETNSALQSEAGAGGAAEEEARPDVQTVSSGGVRGIESQADQIDEDVDASVMRRITFTTPRSPMRHRDHSRLVAMQGVGARPNIMNHPSKIEQINQTPGIQKLEEDAVSVTDDNVDKWQALLKSAFIGRNSQFSNLTLEERHRLGGVEYRAIKILALVVPLYYVLWQLIGCIGLGAYVALNRPDTTLVNGLNPWWVGAFNGVSAFNNNGMSLLDANMVAFQTSNYMLITMGLMILAGNTCYPIFLRLILWVIWKWIPETSVNFRDTKTTLRFLLDHPRRCYTNLFPSRHTWWLLLAVICLNGTDWLAFEVLNLGNKMIEDLPVGVRVIDGLFQAIAVRSGGFYVVSVAQLRIGLLILYVIMMYISVYPVVITIRNSNVYEERSLGIYADEISSVSQSSATTPAPLLSRLRRTLSSSTTQNRVNTSTVPNGDTSTTTASPSKESRTYFLRQQLRSQLSHDIWWISLAVLFIAITETSQFERDPVSYSVFNILFEVVSAYGCVGISVGLPNEAYSFCGGFHVLSKLILCAVMLRGRHRGLPVAIDRAVLLPGENLAAAEEEDARIRARANSGSRPFGEKCV